MSRLVGNTSSPTELGDPKMSPCAATALVECPLRHMPAQNVIDNMDLDSLTHKHRHVKAEAVAFGPTL